MNAIVKTEESNMLAVIERAAANPEIDVDKMKALLDMQERIFNKRAEMEFNDAMMKSQSEIGRVATDKTNNQTHSTYASYAALDRVVRPVYTKHGFSLSFNTGDSPAPDIMRVLCDVSHSGGHTRKYKVDMPADGKGAKGGDVMTKTHAAGSAMQYGQRYLLKLIFNIAIGKDDDGNAAGDKATLITEHQAANLQALVEETAADKAAFLKWFSGLCKKQLESLSDIPANAYDQAVKALEAKRKAKK